MVIYMYVLIIRRSISLPALSPSLPSYLCFTNLNLLLHVFVSFFLPPLARPSSPELFLDAGDGDGDRDSVVIASVLPWCLFGDILCASVAYPVLWGRKFLL